MTTSLERLLRPPLHPLTRMLERLTLLQKQGGANATERIAIANLLRDIADSLDGPLYRERS
jgi:hypothetical protein